ncbi:MAG TPA: hypothetical protein VMF60_09330 [Acidimicrobiales bacterium]|nr:hypothetical protein [Acidimicrobiales bacterium]
MHGLLAQAAGDQEHRFFLPVPGAPHGYLERSLSDAQTTSPLSSVRTGWTATLRDRGIFHQELVLRPVERA